MKASLTDLRQQINDYLAAHLKDDCDGTELTRAMEYSLMAGGKRLRPLLTLAVANTLGQSITPTVLRAAGAVELVHTYSLIHDDLPAMDDDDLRRGKPTNHRVFGAGLATLAGDGLLTLAFQWLSANQLDPLIRLTLVTELAQAAGPAGMVAGQARDITATGAHLSLSDLKQLHREKTGALLRYAVVAGGVLARVTPAVKDALAAFGRSYGLAYQIYDDLLDVTATSAQVGKQTHKDAAEGKNTYPNLIGVLESERTLKAVVARAVAQKHRLQELTGKDFAVLDEFLAYFQQGRES